MEKFIIFGKKLVKTFGLILAGLEPISHYSWTDILDVWKK